MTDEFSKFKVDIKCEHCGSSYNNLVDQYNRNYRPGDEHGEIADVLNYFPEGHWYCSNWCHKKDNEDYE